jgi:Tfp pilus assembly protein PilO
MNSKHAFDAFDRWGATALMVAVAIAYCTFVDLPYGKATTQLRSETAERRRVIADSEKLVPQIERMVRDADDAERYVDQWRRSTPKSGAVSALFGEIHHAVRRTGVEVTRFEPQPAVSLSTIEQRPISLTIEGRHAEVAAAVVHLEQLPATIWVKDVVVTPVTERAEIVKFECKVVVFADNAGKSD